MALVKCPDCSKEVSDSAPSCPNCGRPMRAVSPPAAASATAPPTENAAPSLAPSPDSNGWRPGPVQGWIGVVVGIGMLWFLFGGGRERRAATNMGNIEQEVLQNAIGEYEFAKKNGGAMDACVQAGLVSVAAQGARDEAAYKKWKAVERNDCAQAGVPGL